MDDTTRLELAVERALTIARTEHQHVVRLKSGHEAYAVILEELEEFKRREQRDKSRMLEKLVQVAAMCQRAAEDLGLSGLLEQLCAP